MSRTAANNPYNLFIRTNWFKDLNQPQGNGVSPFNIKGCFSEDGRDFIINVVNATFEMWVGKNDKYSRLSYRIPVEGDDMLTYEQFDYTILKYANQLIDYYKANYTEIWDSEGNCIKCSSDNRGSEIIR